MKKPFEFKPWMLVTLIIACLLLLVFNFDPVGDSWRKIFGPGTEKWAVNIVLVPLIIYTFIKKK